MFQLIGLIQTLATHITADNIEHFVTLIEGLVKLAESTKEESSSK